jgi:hypothetical protein
MTVGDIEKEVVQNQGYIVCFTMYSAIYGLGVIAWLFIDPTKPIIPDGPTEPTPALPAEGGELA